jgi:intracellular multiplication protein IcmS
MEIQKAMILISKSLKTNFTLKGKPISYEEVFSETGLLPALARRADQLCSLCLGYGIGVSFEEAENTLLGVKVAFDNVTPSSLRYLCITDVLTEIIQMSGSPINIALDELMYD